MRGPSVSQLHEHDDRVSGDDAHTRAMIDVGLITQSIAHALELLGPGPIELSFHGDSQIIACPLGLCDSGRHGQHRRRR